MPEKDPLDSYVRPRQEPFRFGSQEQRLSGFYKGANQAELVAKMSSKDNGGTWSKNGFRTTRDGVLFLSVSPLTRDTDGGNLFLGRVKDRYEQQAVSQPGPVFLLLLFGGKQLMKPRKLFASVHTIKITSS